MTSTVPGLFDTVLVANRGEIAVRIMRTLRSMGIRSVAVYSDADVDSPHVLAADVAVHIGPTPAAESYLRIERIMDAARQSGAQAIHPGYGFLSENVDFARACAEAGIVFIGPPVDAIDAMGDKIRAKQTAIAAGVPVVPGRHDPHMSDQDIITAAGEVGYPVLLKPSAGGGGKGMRIVRAEDELSEAISSARRESKGAFGDDTLLLERFVDQPRHIEVQILADAHGTVLHLGERECSLQRRHQKVIEEAPSPLLNPDTREALCASAVRLAAAVGYVGAGTVEYVVPSGRPEEFAFLEMNTRLQVEHPVTEMVTGIDLVEQQLRVAAGERLSISQSDIRMNGHALEARIYAEDPTRGFLPTGGELLAWQPPAGIRVDSGVSTGSTIGSAYDPMLAKVIVHADTREQAIDELEQALQNTIALGVVTNIDYLVEILRDDRVRAGALDTALLDKIPATVKTQVPSHIGRAVMMTERSMLPAGSGWRARDGWRVQSNVPLSAELSMGENSFLVDDATDEFDDQISIESVTVFRDGSDRWVHDPQWGTARLTYLSLVDRRIRSREAEGHGGGEWAARSPMPGTVVAVHVHEGEEVDGDQPLVVVEAMKMEHTMRAPAAGTVTEVPVSAGDQVKLDDLLVSMRVATPEGGAA
jgi:acetyl-CoA/propionyl-CoA carboxylase biotin carboxyl carrier protein